MNTESITVSPRMVYQFTMSWLPWGNMGRTWCGQWAPWGLHDWFRGQCGEYGGGFGTGVASDSDVCLCVRHVKHICETCKEFSYTIGVVSFLSWCPLLLTSG